jgi:hypothetical protein
MGDLERHGGSFWVVKGMSLCCAYHLPDPNLTPFLALLCDIGAEPCKYLSST